MKPLTMVRVCWTNRLVLIVGLFVAPLSHSAAAESLPPFLLDVNALNASLVSSNATKALTTPIATVVDKPKPSPTGNPHDYISYGRYWWPNPATSNGLPFIRRDGYANKEQTSLGDHARLGRMIETVGALAEGWYLEQRNEYAIRAGEWIRAWLITPDTRMNPSLDYAQVRLGHNKSRGSGSGIIDTRDFTRLVDSLRLLHGSPALTGEDERVVRRWFSDYLHWLTTSRNGKLEHKAPNNHGSWYLAQVIAIARYLDQDEKARTFAKEDFERIAKQFKPDGSQPLEIARADGLGYSVFNLEAQFRIARLAAPLGVDLWSYTGSNGASLRKGLEFLRPYDTAPETWPHSQLKKLKPGFLQPLLAQAARVWSNDISQRNSRAPK